jgi:hypothetical protein
MANPFLNPVESFPASMGSGAAVAETPASPAAPEQIKVSDGVLPLVPSETEGAVSVSAASSDISHIGEIFHWVRKLMKDDRRFHLNEEEFMAAIDEEPLFLRQVNG